MRGVRGKCAGGGCGGRPGPRLWGVVGGCVGGDGARVRGARVGHAEVWTRRRGASPGVAGPVACGERRGGRFGPRVNGSVGISVEERWRSGRRCSWCWALGVRSGDGGGDGGGAAPVDPRAAGQHRPRGAGGCAGAPAVVGRRVHRAPRGVRRVAVDRGPADGFADGPSSDGGGRAACGRGPPPALVRRLHAMARVVRETKREERRRALEVKGERHEGGGREREGRRGGRGGGGVVISRICSDRARAGVVCRPLSFGWGPCGVDVG